MNVAKVTATKDGDTLENAAAITDTDLACLLDYADQILVHEIHSEEWVADRKARYPDEWDRKVTVLADSEDDKDDDSEDDDGEPTCRHVDCDEPATQTAICEQGQKKHYCDAHAGGSRAGAALVTEWVDV